VGVRQLRSERGQSVLELVLILPLLVAIFAILVFFGLQGWRLSPDHGAVRLYYNDWDRGTSLTCRVGYKVRVSDIPLVGWFYSGGGGVRVQAATTLRVEQYKSRWD